MLTTRWQNQTLSPQQILTPSTTHNILALRPQAAPRARRRLHYLEETKHNNIYESSSMDHSHHCHTHVQRNTLNELPLVTIGWTPVTVTIILRQALRAPKSPIDKKLGDSLCMSIPRRMFIVPISGGFLICPNTYWTLDSFMTFFPWIWVWKTMMAWST
jgi:hypothetical protein